MARLDHDSPKHALVLVAAVALAALAGLSLQRRGGERRAATAPAPTPAYYQAEVIEAPGLAVAILVDLSGSMGGRVPGSDQPKIAVARQALDGVLAATEDFTHRRPGYPVQVALYGFNGSPWRVMPFAPYDRRRVAAGLAGLPSPGGGTAIGSALLAARADLYRSGAVRKHILVVTDGQNTVGSDPARVAREIHAKSRGAVGISFVAFDTDPGAFGFLRDVGGDVVAAQDAAGLRKALEQLYAGKILAEADASAEAEAPTSPHATDGRAP